MATKTRTLASLAAVLITATCLLMPRPPLVAQSGYYFGSNYTPVSGGGTITAITGTTCSNATTCTQSTGIASGDLVFGFAGDGTTTIPGISGNNCSSSGSVTGQTTSTWSAIGMWCIVNTTTVTFTATSCTTCGMEVVPFHSSNGWSTASVLSNHASVADGATVTGPSVSPTGSSSVVVGFFTNDNAGSTNTASSPWSLGPSAGAQNNATAYQINVAAAAYSPVFARTPAVSAQWAAITISMSTN